MNTADSRHSGNVARHPSSRGASGRAWALPIVLAIAGLIVFLHYLRPQPSPLPRDAVSPSTQIPTPATPAPAEQSPATAPPAPTKAAAPSPPLPALDASDDALKSALADGIGDSAVERFLRPEQIVRRIVVTIDNLPRAKVALAQRPIKPTPDDFVANGSDEAPTLGAENYARYGPFVEAVGALDAKSIVALYRRYYPLFQQAYRELGYPQGNFNARLLEVIDSLLATPNVPQPVRLVRPNVLYEFTDKHIESLPAGQKLLIRMGPKNAAIIKAKLRQIRALIAAAQTPAADSTRRASQLLH